MRWRLDQRRLTSDEFRNVVGHFATGVTVITALAGGRPLGTTASAVTSLSLEPPMMLVCLDRESQTGQAIAAAGRFAVNILGEGQADLARRLATKAPDKFDGVETAPGGSGVPLLADALATLECRVVDRTTGGTHIVFFGEVEQGSARSGAPLAYYRGQFGRLQLGSSELDSAPS
jgi:flavin reductase (DIM6/NTAB) family NADH-FMN oxidoreductase RutF